MKDKKLCKFLPFPKFGLRFPTPCNRATSINERNPKTYFVSVEKPTHNGTILSSKSKDFDNWHLSVLPVTTMAAAASCSSTRFAARLTVQEVSAMEENECLIPVSLHGQREFQNIKLGPWGNETSQNWGFQLTRDQTIKEIIVRHGSVVDAITFVLVDKDGVITTTHRWGGSGGRESKIVLDSSKEYVTQISGIHADFINHRCVTLLRIHTNLQPNGYGPFGLQRDTTNPLSFSSPELNDGAIIGFHGGAGHLLNSIGIYVKPDFMNFGPWGGKETIYWGFRVPEGGNIKEISLRTGAVVIDSISFKIDDGSGKTSIMKFGGDGGENFCKISFTSKEYITGISGLYADWKNQRHIIKIIFHTNLFKDYVAYGRQAQFQELSNVVAFSTPREGYKVVGFYGGSRSCIDAIGVYVKTL